MAGISTRNIILCNENKLKEFDHSKENLSKKVVLYMLKIVAKEKPVYFVPFGLYFIANLMHKAEAIILPKFLIVLHHIYLKFAKKLNVIRYFYYF